MLHVHTSIIPYGFLLSFRRRPLSPAGRSVLLLRVTAQRTVCLQTPQQGHSPLPINLDVVDPLKMLRALPHQIKRLELRQEEGPDGAGREQHLPRILPPQPQLIQSVARHQNSRKKQNRKERHHRDRLTCKGNWVQQWLFLHCMHSIISVSFIGNKSVTRLSKLPVCLHMTFLRMPSHQFWKLKVFFLWFVFQYAENLKPVIFYCWVMFLVPRVQTIAAFVAEVEEWCAIKWEVWPWFLFSSHAKKNDCLVEVVYNYNYASNYHF